MIDMILENDSVRLAYLINYINKVETILFDKLDNINPKFLYHLKNSWLFTNERSNRKLFGLVNFMNYIEFNRFSRRLMSIELDSKLKRLDDLQDREKDPNVEHVLNCCNITSYNIKKSHTFYFENDTTYKDTSYGKIVKYL